MKKTKFIVLGFLLVSLLLPYIAVARARDPKYVGIKEGDTFIWNTEFDKGPLEDYYMDDYNEYGITEETAEEWANDDFRYYHWDEGYVQWKIHIWKIGDEGDERVFSPSYSIDKEILRTKYQYSLYKTKNKDDSNAWKCKERWSAGKIWDNDEDLYFLLLNQEMGIMSQEDWHAPEFFLPKNLDFGELVDMQEEWIVAEGEEDISDVGTVKIQNFNEKKTVGFWTEQGDTEYDVEDFESESRYNDDGVLYYYEYSYDGDIIAKFEKEYILGQNSEFYFENWWWMSLAAGAVVLGVIIVICIIIKKKKS